MPVYILGYKISQVNPFGSFQVILRTTVHFPRNIRISLSGENYYITENFAEITYIREKSTFTLDISTSNFECCIDYIHFIATEPAYDKLCLR